MRVSEKNFPVVKPGKAFLVSASVEEILLPFEAAGRMIDLSPALADAWCFTLQVLRILALSLGHIIPGNQDPSGLKIAAASGSQKGGIMKRVREIMTSDPVCCTPADSVTEVARWMKREDVGSVPVVKDRKTTKLVGIVTDRDLVLKVLAESRDPSNTRVEEVMTRNPVACREEDDLESCLDAMEKHQIRRMPIVDGQQKIVGIIAQADVATRGGEPEKTAELVEEISE